jgi:hypothetical protein
VPFAIPRVRCDEGGSPWECSDFGAPGDHPLGAIEKQGGVSTAVKVASGGDGMVPSD